MDQVQYYRELANAYSAKMLENIAFYKAIMAKKISTIMASTKEYVGYMIAKTSLYYSWCKEMAVLGIQKGIAGFHFAYSSFLYYCKEFPGWMKNSTIWLINKFKQGFNLGYNLLCKLGNLLFDLTKALYNAVKHLAIKALNAVWHFVVNFSSYLQKTWNFLAKIASLLKDFTIALKEYLVKGWHLAVIGVKSMTSTVVNLASKAINQVLPIAKALANKALSQLAKGLGMIAGMCAAIAEIIFDKFCMTIGICGAIVDLLFEGLGYLLPNIGLLAGMVAPLKAGLTLGLAGLGAYGTYLGGIKVYNFMKTLFAADAPQPMIAANPVVAQQQPGVVANPEVAQPQAQIVPLFNAQRAQANQAERLQQEAQAIEPEARRESRLNAAIG